jgi:molecular chaperone DnaJ
MVQGWQVAIMGMNMDDISVQFGDIFGGGFGGFGGSG